MRYVLTKSEIDALATNSPSDGHGWIFDATNQRPCYLTSNGVHDIHTLKQIVIPDVQPGDSMEINGSSVFAVDVSQVLSIQSDNLETALLIHPSTVAGSTTFVDSSPYVHNINVTGSVTNSSDTQPSGSYGSTSIKFEGGYLDIDSSAIYNMGQANWSLDLWINTLTTTWDTIVDMESVVRVETEPLGALCRIRVAFRNNTGGVVYIRSDVNTTAINDGNWHHIEINKQNTAGRVFVDGILHATTTIPTGDVGGEDVIVRIGSNTAGFNVYEGYLSEVRFQVGIIGHTSNFTPPDAVYPNVTGYTTLTPGVDYTVIKSNPTGTQNHTVVYTGNKDCTLVIDCL